MVAAARPITPGSVQPGNGTTRSCAPVAAISRGAVNASWPAAPATSTRKPRATDQTRQPRPIREVRPETPEGLAAVLERMMARDRDERYQTAGEVSDALAPWTETPIAPPPEDEMPHRCPAVREFIASSELNERR